MLFQSIRCWMNTVCHHLQSDLTRRVIALITAESGRRHIRFPKLAFPIDAWTGNLLEDLWQLSASLCQRRRNFRRNVLSEGKAILKRNTPRRCQLCGRWFRHEYASKTRYRECIAPGETERTCREAGTPAVFEKKRGKLEHRTWYSENETGKLALPTLIALCLIALGKHTNSSPPGGQLMNLLLWKVENSQYAYFCRSNFGWNVNWRGKAPVIYLIHSLNELICEGVRLWIKRQNARKICVW